MSKKTRGRMLNRDIANSQKLPLLSKNALVLFFFLIPFYDSWGKMNGDPFFIKGEILMRYPWFTIAKIKICLKEISNVTSVKWFNYKGLYYIHALNWEEHQTLKKDKRGVDRLPNYHNSLKTNSGVKRELVPHEVEVEVESKEELKVKEEVKGNSGLKNPEVTEDALQKGGGDEEKTKASGSVKSDGSEKSGNGKSKEIIQDGWKHYEGDEKYICAHPDCKRQTAMVKVDTGYCANCDMKLEAKRRVPAGTRRV